MICCDGVRAPSPSRAGGEVAAAGKDDTAGGAGANELLHVYLTGPTNCHAFGRFRYATVWQSGRWMRRGSGVRMAGEGEWIGGGDCGRCVGLSG